MPIGVIGGTLLAAALKGIFDVGSTIFSNQYNSEKAKLRRLREAGLPLSYMYRGNVSTQSEVPKLSIEPSLGVEKKLSLDNQTKLANSQSEKLDIDNAIQEGIKNWLQGKSSIKVGEKTITGTNQELNLKIDQVEKLAVSFLRDHEQQLKSLELQAETILFGEGITVEEKRQGLVRIRQQITNMVKQAGLMDQLDEMRDFEAFINSTITESIKSLPEWAQAITAALLKAASYK